jgi:hypothetical protein
MTKCGKCGISIEGEEIYGFFGESLCEDCYLERRLKLVACDPWAVWAARSFNGETPQLTGIQEGILKLIKSRGSLEAPEICTHLGLSEAQFQNNFATLRHMQLVRASRVAGKVRYILF